MVRDVSNQTVFVLAVLAICISVLSVATILFETSDFVDVGGNQQYSSSGTISVSIKESPEEVISEGVIRIALIEDNETLEG